MNNIFRFSFSKAMNLGLLTLILIATLGLAGCSEYRKANESVAKAENEAERALTKIEPRSPVAQPLTVDRRPYYGSQAIPITNGTALPTRFEQSNAIVMTFARPVTLDEFTRMIQAVTGLRANVVNGNTSAASGLPGGTSSGKTFVPANGERVAGGRVVWQGRLSDLMNQAADVFGAEWRFDGSTVSFSRQVTRTFMLHALASELNLSGSVKSGSSGDSSSNLPEIDVTSTSSLKIWEEIKESVATIMGDNGKAAFSPSTGTITVAGTPDTVRRVESYLNHQNSMRLRRVAVAVKILSVTTSNALTLTSNLTGILKKAFDQASLRTVGEATAGIAIGVLKKPESATDIAAIDADRIITELKAAQGVERAQVAHSGAIVTLSDQPAPLQVGKQISYLKRTSSTSGDTGGSVSLEPGTINTGLLMTILPRIVEHNRVLMRLSVAITDAQQPFATFGSGSGDSSVQIQLPEVETTGFLQNAVMTSGETLVLAGFEKSQDSASDTGTPGSFLFGGTRATNRSRELTILLLTTEILPEEPITVIGQ